jgi:hypothetical protein
MKSYLSVLNEDTKKNSSVAADNTGELDGAENAKKFIKDSGPDAVKTEKPVKGPHSEQDSDSLPKSVSSESKNPFDLLYNKILAQEAFGDEEGDSLDFSGEIEDSEGDEMDFDVEGSDDEMGEEGEEEGEEESEKEGLEAVLDHLKNAVSALESLIGEEEGEEDEDMGEDMGEDDLGDDLEDEVEIDDIPMSKESVEAEIEGHALVNKDRLEKGLTSKPKQKVKNAVPVSKKKAQVSKGSKFDGKPQPFKSNPHELTNPSKHNVGGVKVGKGLFDQ